MEQQDREIHKSASTQWIADSNQGSGPKLGEPVNPPPVCAAPAHLKRRASIKGYTAIVDERALNGAAGDRTGKHKLSKPHGRGGEICLRKGRCS